MIKLYYPKFWQTKNILSYILLPFGYIYLLLGKIRKIFANPIRFKAHVICIGNATIGGTGKTQLVIKLAQEFSARNINFIIICKGYGGKNTHYSLVSGTSSPFDVGDEALELHGYGVTFSVPKLEYIPEIIAKYKPDIVLMDDGMQNPNFIKDFIIMTVDGMRGFGNEFPIPAGPMRCDVEEAFNLTNAIVCVDGNIKIDSKKPLFSAKICAKQNLKSGKYYAFAGIGNPQKFFDTLKDAGATLIKEQIFPDHYNYSKNEILELMSIAKKLGAKLITTRKDYVKIKHIFYEVKEDFTHFATEMVLGPTIDKKIPELAVNYLEIDFEVKDVNKLVDMATKL